MAFFHFVGEAEDEFAIKQASLDGHELLLRRISWPAAISVGRGKKSVDAWADFFPDVILKIHMAPLPPSIFWA